MARKLRGFERVLDAPALFADRVRRDRVLAVHRARDRRRRRARADAARAPRRGRGVRARLALLRRGDDRAARDRRSGDVRAARVQRPRRVRDRLGALPRLPHRHGALGALRAALLRRGVRHSRRCASRRGTRSSAAGSSSSSPASGSSGGRDSTSARSPSRSSTSLVQALLVVLGLAFLLSPSHARRRPRLRERRRTGATSRSRFRSRCSRTRGSRRSRTSPRRRPSPAGRCPLALLRDRARRRRDGSHRRDRPLRVSRSTNGETALGEEWLELPLVGIAAGVRRIAARPGRRRARGRGRASPASSSSSARRRRRSRGSRGSRTRSREHGSLPREFARLERRAVVSSEAIAIAAGLAIGLIVVTELVADGDPAFLASLYSFGVLIAFTAAQLAVDPAPHARAGPRAAVPRASERDRFEGTGSRSRRSSERR